MTPAEITPIPAADNVWTNGTGFTFSESSGILTYSAIPEPSTYAALVGASALGLTAFRRRRSH